ncbi:MAG: iron-sulfur cluster carrier protein ApbC [Cellvibrionaceae bacterium]
MSLAIDPQFMAQAIQPILEGINDPLSEKSLAVLDAVSDIELRDKYLSLSLTLGYPGDDAKKAVVTSLGEALLALPEVDKVDIDAGWQAPFSASIEGKKPVPNVRNVIAVASGKGGVGKSTTTVNLALAMAQLGAKVGILDADIYGPSQPQMLGVANQRPQIRDQQAMIPVESYGVQSISMGYLLSENTPTVWRGPMATGALQQLIFQTDWHDLDYLFVDMPPGTGDIQLTLSQQVPVSGAVVVTTPQDIALLDAKKAIEMFSKVNIPILGVVENMAVHHCSQCGHEEHIFGEGGGGRIADDYGSQLLGALPLALSIREDADGGKPSVVADPNSSITSIYTQTAQKVAAALWVQRTLESDMPEIAISDD